MNWKHNIYGLFVILLLASCKSIKSYSAGNQSANAKKRERKDVRFLNGINVAPGGVTYPSVAEKKRFDNKTKITYTAPDLSLTSFNIEKADWLQLKYAIVLDATVETLTNVSLLQNIDKWWGTRYCMGGSTDKCIDCSAFTQILMRDVYNTSVPRTAQDQYDQTERVEVEDLKEGDLVFFHTTGGDITHVGIYLLNNKFVHAATSNGVSVSDLNDSYWKPRYRGAGRMGK